MENAVVLNEIESASRPATVDSDEVPNQVEFRALAARCTKLVREVLPKAGENKGGDLLKNYLFQKSGRAKLEEIPISEWAVLLPRLERLSPKDLRALLDPEWVAPFAPVKTTDPEFLEAWRAEVKEIVARGKRYGSEWDAAGRAINKTMWDLADCLIKGEERISEMYDEAVKITPFTRETLQNMVSVARRFHDISRRRENVPFWQHAQVAALKDDGVQDGLLEDSARRKLSTRELRKEVKKVGRDSYRRDEQKKRSEGKLRRIGVWMPPAPYKALKRIAEVRDMQVGNLLAEWCQAHFTANRTAILAQVKEIEAKIKQEKQKRLTVAESQEPTDRGARIREENKVERQVA